MSQTDIQVLSTRFRNRVNELHDDFVHTRRLWQAQLIQAAGGGSILRVVNPITKNVVSTGTELNARARASQDRLRVRCFKEMTAEFELFVDALLRIWLTNRPTLLSAKGVTVGTVLAAQTLAEVQAAAISKAVEATILEKLKGKPEGWLMYLKNNLQAVYVRGDEMSFVEMKARRDVLEHHDGIVERTYLDKARTSAKYQAGEAIVVQDQHVDEVHALILRLIEATATSAIAQLSV